MVTSVGMDAPTACASIRAGVAMPRPIPYFQILNAETQEAEPLIGHAIRGFTEGFVFVGAWIRLALGALSDLARQGALPGASARGFWANTGLIAVTPHLSDDRYAEDCSVRKDAAGIREAYLERIEGAAGLPLSPKHVEVLGLGHAGTAAAVALARGWLQAGLERVIVLAVDSYLDRFTLEWLADHRRLKIDDNPCGLVPGQAGACFLLETELSSSRRGATASAVIEAASTSAGAHHGTDQGQRADGAGVARAVVDVLGDASPEAPFRGDIVLDLNGETWRAATWGNALARFAQRVASGTRLVLPCSSLGEVGAASGAVGVCVAARALARGYSSGDRAIVASCSEWGQAGALRLRAAGAPG
ncbi:hypothetical protein BE21_02570 [Sorangium cellulosum]|uniref:Beta-ketoacyl synthase N-terminal domain-containing protein n=1 Tax=Sorangium cellulosum TaxID=56 RepID=A0A150TRQ7_SORCE|nr:hypothetical protein BE21_02570 [Sorangium cellulosum]